MLHRQWKSNRLLDYVWKENWWEHLMYAFCELNICVLTPRWNHQGVTGSWGQISSMTFEGKIPRDLIAPSATWNYNRWMVFISIFFNFFYLCFIDYRVETLHFLPHIYPYFILHCLYNYIMSSQFPLDSLLTLHSNMISRIFFFFASFNYVVDSLDSLYIRISNL